MGVGNPSSAPTIAGTTMVVPTPIRFVATAGTSPQVLKNGPCTLANYQLFNKSVVPRYVRLYDMATTPDPATSPVKIGPIPLASMDDVSSPGGMSLTFANGLAIAITGAADDGDTTAIAAGDVNGFVGVI